MLIQGTEQNVNFSFTNLMFRNVREFGNRFFLIFQKFFLYTSKAHNWLFCASSKKQNSGKINDHGK